MPNLLSRFTCRATVVCALGLLAACASAPPVPTTESKMTGDAIALLGEVHDNDEGHERRLLLLGRVFAAGWRPTIAMEQFDLQRQADIDRARREEPTNAQHVIDLAAPPNSGWDWSVYRPVIELAMKFNVPLVAANLSSADTTRIVREGYGSVFDAARLQALGLAQAIDPAWQAAQDREIDSGHCGALSPTMIGAMARAQFARDAVMAGVLRAHAGKGVVLLAGNGHVRRDLGVARWLTPEERARTIAVGYLEADPTSTSTAATAAVVAPMAANFDAVVLLPAAARADPCEAFMKRRSTR